MTVRFAVIVAVAAAAGAGARVLTRGRAVAGADQYPARAVSRTATTAVVPNVAVGPHVPQLRGAAARATPATRVTGTATAEGGAQTSNSSSGSTSQSRSEPSGSSKTKRETLHTETGGGG